MRKLLPSTIRRREETRKRREEFEASVAAAYRRLDELDCKTPRDPYSDERDYDLTGGLS